MRPRHRRKTGGSSTARAACNPALLQLRHRRHHPHRRHPLAAQPHRLHPSPHRRRVHRRHRTVPLRHLQRRNRSRPDQRRRHLRRPLGHLLRRQPVRRLLQRYRCRPCLPRARNSVAGHGGGLRCCSHWPGAVPPGSSGDVAAPNHPLPCSALPPQRHVAHRRRWRHHHRNPCRQALRNHPGQRQKPKLIPIRTTAWSPQRYLNR